MSVRDPRDLEREPPVNLQAEQALLGCLLDSNKVWDSIAGLVTAEAFSDGAHQRIFERIQHLVEKGQPANAVTLKNAFERDAGLAEVGGAQYLASLQASAVTPSMAPGFARLVTDTYLRRRGIAICEDAIDALHDFDLGGGSSEAVRQAADQLDEAAREAQQAGGQGPRDLRELVPATLDVIDLSIRRRAAHGSAGLSTGLVALDNFIGGLMPGELIVVGGRTSMGKTSLMESMIWASAQAPLEDPERPAPWTYVVSFEMKGEQLLQRQAARLTGVNLKRIRRGELTYSDFGRISDGLRGIVDLPVKVDDRIPRKLGPLVAQARYLKRRRGLRLVVVDYLQRMRAQDAKGKRRDEVLADITSGLKDLAGDLDVPVVALSQINRGPTDRENRRPTLGDLKESGAIEEDADAALLLHREEYYLRHEQPQRKAQESADRFSQRFMQWQDAMQACEGQAEIIVAKQRQGEQGIVNVLWNGRGACFEDPPSARRESELDDAERLL